MEEGEGALRTGAALPNEDSHVLSNPLLATCAQKCKCCSDLTSPLKQVFLEIKEGLVTNLKLKVGARNTICILKDSLSPQTQYEDKNIDKDIFVYALKLLCCILKTLHNISKTS